MGYGAVDGKLGSCGGRGDTYNGTNSAIDGNHDTHHSVAENASADCHFPAQTGSDQGRSCTKRFRPALTESEEHIALTDFPIGHGPGVGHPIGYVGLPGPCSVAWRNGVEVGIGRVCAHGKTTGFLRDGQAEAEAFLECGRLTHFDRLDLRGARGAKLLLAIGFGLGFVVVGSHGRRCWRW